jgi:elongation factor P
MASTSDIKNGLCIKHNHDLFKVIEFLHVKPGKGPAFVRTKLKSLTSGKVLDNTFPSGAKIEAVRVETRKYQYLYAEDTGFHFMHTETFEQIFIEKTMVGGYTFMKEGEIVEVVFDADEENPLTCDVPSSVVLEVTYTEPGEKGNTATNALKPATVETGANVNVPLFINEGDKIKIDTVKGAYQERVRN